MSRANIRPQPNTGPLYEAAVDAYGLQGARDIFTEIHASVLLANEVLLPPRPINALQLGIGRLHDCNGKEFNIQASHTKIDGFEMLLGKKSAKEIIPHIRPTVFHEGSHMTFYQYGLQLGYYDGNENLTLFDFVANEGVAVQAEIEGVGSSPLSWEAIPSHSIESGLRTALDAGQTSDDERFAFLEGYKRVPMFGYKLGHFVVASMVEQGSTLQDLLEMPYSEFRKAAEGLL